MFNAHVRQKFLRTGFDGFFLFFERLRLEQGPPNTHMGFDVLSHHDVFKHRHFFEQANVLKGSCNPCLGHQVHGTGLVPHRIDGELALIGFVQTRDDVKEGGLARTVGADESIDLALSERQIDALQSLQAPKVFAGSEDFQDDARLTHCSSSLVCRSGAGHRP